VTPAPWVNVLANAHFGSVISENGSADTWSENAHEFRLTPWNNDSVSDAGGEAFYLRDEESGHFWSPTPLPSREAVLYQPSRIRLQRFRVHRGRYPFGVMGLCGTGRSDKMLVTQGTKRVGTVSPALCHRLCGTGDGR